MMFQKPHCTNLGPGVRGKSPRTRTEAPTTVRRLGRGPRPVDRGDTAGVEPTGPEHKVVESLGSGRSLQGPVQE